MKLSFQKRLYQLALEQAKCNLHLRSMSQAFDNSHMNQEIYKLALATRGVDSLSNPEILPTFFTAEAVVLLLRVPNIYWFWRTVHEACLHDHDADDALLSKASVVRGIKEIRSSHSYQFNLGQGLADLVDDPKAEGQSRRETQIALRAVAGLILVKCGSLWDPASIIDNPFFFEPSFVECLASNL
ncbi:MAG: hypothetical protein WC028_31850 [Candidatus Obscuribacterales bacterium]|jgi:hypothetical protein